MPYTRLDRQNPNCLACPVSGHCPSTCEDARVEILPGGAAPVPLPHAGKMLYAVGTPAFAIYMVRAGCMKTVTTDPDGNEHVRAFHFPGDYIGLDALGAAAYPSSAVAVVPSQVCRISKGHLKQMTQASAQCLEKLLERASLELRNALGQSGNYTAEQRVAAFLLAMEGRLADKPGAEFEPPMTRRDMANHLRLATETVCRVMGRFADHGWLRGGNLLKVLQRSPLSELAQPIGTSHQDTRLAA